MIINYSFVFCCCLLLFSYSCTDADNNAVQIRFAKIVGSYIGESKICKEKITSLDTTCSNVVFNKMKVILYDNISIIVEDEQNIYGKNKLTYTADTTILDETIFIFDSQEVTKKMKLFYYKNAGEIKVSHPSANGSQSWIDYFNGKRQ